MRITFVLPTFGREPGGGVSVVYRLANGLVARGHEVTVVHVARFRERPRVGEGRIRRQAEELLSGWRDWRRGAPDGVAWIDVDPRVTRTYHERLRADVVPDGDVVVATAWQTADPIAALGPEKGLGTYLVQGLETWSAGEARVDATWRLPLRKVFIASWLHERAAAMGLGDIHRVQLAIDTDKYRIVRPLEARGPRVVMLGSPEPAKGTAEGAAVLDRARADLPDLTACCFGVGPRPAVLPDWVEYVRDPPQSVLVDDIYNSAAVYLCPSRGEGWHLVAAEAMACGAAVVSTDIPGVADFARDGETALLRPVGDTAGLARGLVRVLTDPDLRFRLATAGHAFVTGHDWAATVDQFERIVAAPAPVGAP